MRKSIQFTRYGGTAIGSALTDYLVFSICLVVGLGTLPSQMFARVAGGIFSFSFNKYWSFASTNSKRLKTEGRRFLYLYVFSYILSLSIVFVLSEFFYVAAYPAKISADVTCFVVNFIVMRNYVFSMSKEIKLVIPSFIKRRR